MSEQAKMFCPECQEDVTSDVGRRDFIKTVGVGAAAALTVGTVPAIARAADAPAAGAKRPRPAEDLVRELHASLTADQRRTVVLPWDHGAAGGGLPTRLHMVNAAINGNRIGAVYTNVQQELITRILRAISSGEDGYRLLTRGGTFDGSRSLDNCGSHIFGDPTTRRFSWVFSGHHITVRCDGNSEPDAAFGGPMYYGHSPDGYSNRNIFYYQTRSVLSVYDALTEAQRRTAIVDGTPGELAPSVRFRPAGEAHPGVAVSDLSADQKRLIEQVMRDVVSPFRREDADEVMDIVRRNGGLDRVHLAFYRDRGAMNGNWHFWRLEGPGFVWNYRVLPHVHTYVQIRAVS